MLALGAAIGTPDSSINSLAISLLGILTPTVFNPAVTLFGIIFSLFLLKIIVSGPGQNLFISLFSISPMFSTICSNMLIFDICTISGLSLALPFATNIFCTALVSKALAPIPYTVSVGNNTNFPSFIPFAASFISSIFTSFSSLKYIDFI